MFVDVRSAQSGLPIPKLSEDPDFPAPPHLADQEGVKTVAQASQAFLASLQVSRNTRIAYRQSLTFFLAVLEEHGVPGHSPISALSQEWFDWLVEGLQRFSPATARLRAEAVKLFAVYTARNGLAAVRPEWLEKLRIPEQRRCPAVPARGQVERVLETVDKAVGEERGKRERLRALRDRALLHLMAEAGLRVYEVCSLRRAHLDTRSGQIIAGARISLTPALLRYLQEYLVAREGLDELQAGPPSSLPLFARHDRSAGNRVLPLSPQAVWSIVRYWTERALGKASRAVTPRSLRQYFVRRLVMGSDLARMQRDARCSSQTLQRYLPE